MCNNQSEQAKNPSARNINDAIERDMRAVKQAQARHGASIGGGAVAENDLGRLAYGAIDIGNTNIEHQLRREHAQLSERLEKLDHALRLINRPAGTVGDTVEALNALRELGYARY